MLIIPTVIALLTFTLSVYSAPTTIQPREYIQFQGLDYSDAALMTNTGNFGDCSGICDKTQSCLGYVMDLTNPIERKEVCWMKSTFTPKSFAKNPLRSTMMLASLTPRRQYSTLPGSDFSDESIVMYQGNLDQCLRACDTLPSCVGYTVNTTQANVCWLRSAFTVANRVQKSNYNAYILPEYMNGQDTLAQGLADANALNQSVPSILSTPIYSSNGYLYGTNPGAQNFIANSNVPYALVQGQYTPPVQNYPGSQLASAPYATPVYTSDSPYAAPQNQVDNSNNYASTPYSTPVYTPKNQVYNSNTPYAFAQGPDASLNNQIYQNALAKTPNADQTYQPQYTYAKGQNQIYQNSN